MVNKLDRQPGHASGQSVTEFLVVLAALTTIGFLLSYLFSPKDGGVAAVAQYNTTGKIAQD